MTYREAYETWLKEFADDRATVDELKAIAGDEKEIEDRFYTELSFGTAGMRGVLGAGTNRMNPTFAARPRALPITSTARTRNTASAAWSSRMIPAG